MGKKSKGRKPKQEPKSLTDGGANNLATQGVASAVLPIGGEARTWSRAGDE